MILTLDLPFKLKDGEEEQFLSADETYALNEARAGALKSLPPDEQNQFRQANVLRAARQDYIQSVANESWGAGGEPCRAHFNRRVSNKLLRMAVDLRYTVSDHRGTRIEIPRHEADRRKPAVWWGQIVSGVAAEPAGTEGRGEGRDAVVGLDDFPATLELSPVQAAWLVSVWFDDKAQNAFPPAMQVWMNVMDEEMGRLRDEVEGEQRP
jgi:hypothetical protein